MLPNIASLQFARDNTTSVLSSNIAAVRVDELLDLTLAPRTPSITLAQGVQGAVPVALANTGNGEESFVLDGRIEAIDARLEGFALDRNGDGLFDAAVDLAIASGGATPPLAPGDTVQLLVLVRGAAAAANGLLHIDARAATGAGAPGSTLAGRGDGGCDAVIGGTTASGSASVSLTVANGSDTSRIQLVKSQAIAGPGGNAVPVRGATVTYTIESRFKGSGVVRSARLADPIPSGTAYVPGSMRLDDIALTDTSDADAGNFDGTGVHVVLGDVVAPATRRIVFQVKIQ
jgi:uncharacterized repeat protein (TIGR01451 family)